MVFGKSVARIFAVMGLAAAALVEAERLWQRLEDTPAHTFEPKGG